MCRLIIIYAPLSDVFHILVNVYFKLSLIASCYPHSYSIKHQTYYCVSKCDCLTGYCQTDYPHKSLINIPPLTHYSMFKKDISQRLQLFLKLLVRKESVSQSVMSFSSLNPQSPLDPPVLDHWDLVLGRLLFFSF